MITPEKEEYVLTKAYIPEHIVSLMTLISKGEPFLIKDYLYFKNDNWLIFIGYPLEKNLSEEEFEAALMDVVNKYNPESTWFIAPEIPHSLLNACQRSEADEYYKLDLQRLKIKSNLMRISRKASMEATVEREKAILKEHERLIADFIELEKPQDMIKQLFLSIPEYVNHSSAAVVLNARDKEKNLSAFYVIDLSAVEFATYVVGCYSRKHYIPHASDLLFLEMINLAKEHKKDYINLGLGVNEGIKRFKVKWGGAPFLKYKFCELSTKRSKAFEFVRLFPSKF